VGNVKEANDPYNLSQALFSVPIVESYDKGNN
jgi:hypothetical protein